MVRASAAASGADLAWSANEDAAYAGRWLFAVADGLAGQAVGDIIEDHTIGTLVGDAGLLAPVLARHLTAGQAIRLIWPSGPGDRHLLRSADSARS